ncbi:MAG TPA: RbsD/FucU domain-containing protein [Oscillospiraceae bacterium]|nr:RbsD/FucU domain-containing protein [Oscillospiraceae bacterium]
MLIGIPDIISPELLKILHEMGHGDEIVIGDGNFPAASCAKRLVRCDGHGVIPVLRAVLKLFPLDTYVESPAILMETSKEDTVKPVIWAEYEKIVKKASPTATLSQVERFEFYDKAKSAYAVIATSEQALYANIILKKGVISDS